LELERLFLHFGLGELVKPENARWLALLIDTEGAMGWTRELERRDRINRQYRYVFLRIVPYISVGMSIFESKATVDEGAELIGTIPVTKAGARRFAVRGGRALTAIKIMQPHFDKYRRMANLLLALYKNRPSAPPKAFREIITELFGTYLTPRQANRTLLHITEEECNQLLEKSRKLADQYLPKVRTRKI
jgi:hypothetical protein